MTSLEEKGKVKEKRKVKKCGENVPLVSPIDCLSRKKGKECNY